jgi:hypothetical protein
MGELPRKSNRRRVVEVVPYSTLQRLHFLSAATELEPGIACTPGEATRHPPSPSCPPTHWLCGVEPTKSDGPR